MKILNPRVGMLSNHEVLTHITAMKARYLEVHQRVGGVNAMKAENLETVMKEVRDYLLASPCANQTDENIQAFMRAVSAYPLEKGELLQIINERPTTVAELDCIIEEMDARFSDDQGQDILAVVVQHLPPRPKEER
ncbi:HRDC-like protein [Sphaerosporella brunnea]|uniref:DNA-directed RNA polymerase III subunit RPC9 n=1 Tax=Sphaerosporella brunnea TaxID=1250544 RepID=A0A5J5F1P2_9PEZI|nr:HRDC-like protein [Sphaerosporella brunnea]